MTIQGMQQLVRKRAQLQCGQPLRLMSTEQPLRRSRRHGEGLTTAGVEHHPEQLGSVVIDDGVHEEGIELRIDRPGRRMVVPGANELSQIGSIQRSALRIVGQVEIVQHAGQFDASIAQNRSERDSAAGILDLEVDRCDLPKRIQLELHNEPLPCAARPIARIARPPERPPEQPGQEGQDRADERHGPSPSI